MSGVIAGSQRARAADALAVIQADSPTTESYLFATAASQVVAQYAAGAPLADTTGPFVVTNPLRTVRIVLGSGGANPVNFTVTGTLRDGSVSSEVITATGAGTYEGVRMWNTITAFSSDVNPAGTTDLRCSAYAFDPATRSIYIGITAGTLVVRPRDGAVDVAYDVTSFSRHPIRASLIQLSSTATKIFAER